MKPAKFTYHAPDTLDEALALLATLGDDAKIVAGGQSLIPVMNLRLAQPEHLVDINALSDLSGVREEAQRLVFGALTRHSDIAASPLVGQRCPILCDAASHIGHLAIRNRGTLGGSLSNADPAAEWSLMAILLDADMTIQSARGSRVARAADFIQSVYTADLEADEILAAIAIPALVAKEGWGLHQISRRAGDFALVAAAVTVTLAENGTIQSLRLALGGMDSTPIRLPDVEAAAVGVVPDDAWVQKAASIAAASGSPESDMHADADYRRDVCAVLVTRAITDALSRARGEISHG